MIPGERSSFSLILPFCLELPDRRAELEDLVSMQVRSCTSRFRPPDDLALVVDVGGEAMWPPPNGGQLLHDAVLPTQTRDR